MTADGAPLPYDQGVEKASQPNFYFENGLLVYTAAYHLNRGSCCGNGCRHCPFAPRHVEGNRNVG